MSFLGGLGSAAAGGGATGGGIAAASGIAAAVGLVAAVAVGAAGTAAVEKATQPEVGKISSINQPRYADS